MLLSGAAPPAAAHEALAEAAIVEDERQARQLARGRARRAPAASLRTSASSALERGLDGDAAGRGVGRGRPRERGQRRQQRRAAHGRARGQRTSPGRRTLARPASRAARSRSSARSSAWLMTAASAVASTTSSLVNSRSGPRCSTSTAAATPRAHDRHGEHRGEALLAEARDVLEVLVAIGDGHRDGQQLLGDEARDALALAQVDAAHGLGGEADVAAHGEDLPVRPRGPRLAHVDAHDVGRRDGRDVGAHAREHLGERPRLARGLDEAEDPVEAAIGALVDQHRRLRSLTASTSPLMVRPRRFRLGFSRVKMQRSKCDVITAASGLAGRRARLGSGAPPSRPTWRAAPRC